MLLFCSKSTRTISYSYSSCLNRYKIKKWFLLSSPAGQCGLRGEQVVGNLDNSPSCSMRTPTRDLYKVRRIGHCRLSLGRPSLLFIACRSSSTTSRKIGAISSRIDDACFRGVVATSLEGFLATHHVVWPTGRSNSFGTHFLVSLPLVFLFFENCQLCLLPDISSLLAASRLLPLETAEAKIFVLGDPSIHEIDYNHTVFPEGFIFSPLVPHQVALDLGVIVKGGDEINIALPVEPNRLVWRLLPLYFFVSSSRWWSEWLRFFHCCFNG